MRLSSLSPIRRRLLAGTAAVGTVAAVSASAAQFNIGTSQELAAGKLDVTACAPSATVKWNTPSFDTTAGYEVNGFTLTFPASIKLADPVTPGNFISACDGKTLQYLIPTGNAADSSDVTDTLSSITLTPDVVTAPTKFTLAVTFPNSGSQVYAAVSKIDNLGLLLSDGTNVAP